MTEKRIDTGSSPEIVIEQVNGNLEVKGWDEAAVELRASPDTLNLQEGDDLLRVSCTGNLELRIPRRADLQVGEVHGQARLRRLEEPLRIGTVYGSLALRELSEVSLDAVDGEFSAREIVGGLKVGRGRGNVSLRNVQGDCDLTQVDGNLEARSLAGNFQASAEGNVRLSLSRMTGDAYQIHAAGNLYLDLPEDADVRLALRCEGNIRVRFPGQPKAMAESSYELTLGDGRAVLNAEAGGNIYLSSLEPDWGASAEPEIDQEADYTRLSEDISRQVEVQIAAQMEAMTRQLNEQMARLSVDLGRAGMSDAEVERIVEKARRSNERAQERAQEKMRRAQEKIERSQEKMQRKMEYRQQREATRGRPPVPPMPPAPPGSRKGWGFEGFGVAQPQAAASGDPVSEEERLMILRMLEQKKISIAEAEQLLAAVEAREGAD
jgi:F0F1-type ATP synthase epsilon subunit